MLKKVKLNNNLRQELTDKTHIFVFVTRVLIKIDGMHQAQKIKFLEDYNACLEDCSIWADELTPYVINKNDREFWQEYDGIDCWDLIQQLAPSFSSAYPYVQAAGLTEGILSLPTDQFIQKTLGTFRDTCTLMIETLLAYGDENEDDFNNTVKFLNTIYPQLPAE